MSSAVKFKKKRLFKVSKELNVSVDTIVEHLEIAGFADALTGTGLNAAITSEDAYLDLVNAYADDKATADRLKEKRAARTESEGAEARKSAARDEVVETPVEPVAAAPEVPAEPEEEEATVAETEPVVEPEVVDSPEKVAPPAATPEPVAAETATPVEPAADKEPDAASSVIASGIKMVCGSCR